MVDALVARDMVADKSEVKMADYYTEDQLKDAYRRGLHRGMGFMLEAAEHRVAKSAETVDISINRVMEQDWPSALNQINRPILEDVQ